MLCRQYCTYVPLNGGQTRGETQLAACGLFCYSCAETEDEERMNLGLLSLSASTAISNTAPVLRPCRPFRAAPSFGVGAVGEGGRGRAAAPSRSWHVLPMPRRIRCLRGVEESWPGCSRRCRRFHGGSGRKFLVKRTEWRDDSRSRLLAKPPQTPQTPPPPP